MVFVLVLAMAYVWFFVYNKPHRNFDKDKPDVVESATSCFQNFLKNPNAAEAGKLVEIYGAASSVERSDSAVRVVFAFRQGMFGDEGIRCTLLPKYWKMAEFLSLKEPLRIKGFCAGYNGTDVIFESCSILKNK